MAVTIRNQAKHLLICTLNSGRTIHLAPFETSAPLQQLEISGNDKIARLVRDGLVSIATQDVSAQDVQATGVQTTDVQATGVQAKRARTSDPQPQDLQERSVDETRSASQPKDESADKRRAKEPRADR